MTLSELCAAAGVPAATVKYYLREGLLPPGERQSATRASYSPAHLDRLRLIRALVEGAGVSIDGVRRVVDAIDEPPATRSEFLGAAQQAINGPVPDVAVATETAAVVQELGWLECAPESLAYLQAAVDTAARAGYPVSLDRLVAYGRAAEQVAGFDIAALEADPTTSTPSGALAHVAVGTVVTDGVLLALRRLAQAQESQRRYATPPRS